MYLDKIENSVVLQFKKAILTTTKDGGIDNDR